MFKPYEGSPQAFDFVRRANVMVPMRDGVRLATDLYVPARRGEPASGHFPAVLERTPYDKAAAGNYQNGAFFARRGYVCAIQDVRGRFASEGEWYPFAGEAPDGYDTVEWLAGQEWCDGKVGTMGGSYCGSDQSALATLNPPHLATMVVAVGASSYYHCSMRQNGALELRFIIYAFRMAATSKEAQADPAI
jgi:putative CocE/NonD family hydrolase